MSESLNAFVEVLRREGLIVVAIGALAYQIYWMTSGFSQADKLWRAEIAEWRLASVETTRARTEAKVELAAVLQKVQDRLNHIGQIAERMDKDCKILMAIDEYKLYLKDQGEQ